jgi:Ni/Fe-hydrogenase subunit HybB-like protein
LKEENKMAQNGNQGEKFIIWSAAIGVGFLIGLFATIYTLARGLEAWGITDQFTWGIVTSSYVFFVAASAGCVTVSLGHALGIKGFELILKRAIILAIATMISGGILIIIHTGVPFNTWLLLTSPNFNSPLGWLAIFYLLYLTLLIFDFYMIHKKDFIKARIFGILAPLAAIAVHSTLGGVFGFASVRHYWGGSLAPVYFIIIAIVIGTALALFATVLQYKVTKTEMSAGLVNLVNTLGKFLAIALGVLAFVLIWKNIAGLNSPEVSTAEAYRYMVAGPAAWWY